ncbi:MFS transporter [Nocardia jinanensis]|uniref:Major facilitator superfamily (MFS) profile domain-containing protein n=1 Tax=Nocardia jinanensis TaxID=382504 RepID=A0A917RTV6_9NOCA|nr:MFS transporter [Nocardia jinanensis]GGL26709.1 hypothetical protein GCM10011588_46900 [Nocardia jinanensis]
MTADLSGAAALVTPAATRRLVPALLLVALVVAVVGSLGAPLITSVSDEFEVSLTAAQWTLTAPLLVGAIATPVLGRLGAGPYRRRVVLVTLALAVVGGLLTVIPPSFGWLLAGRVAQGAGLGLTALMMGIARDHLPAERSGPVIALLSVASAVGIGVGYPLAGLLTEVGGLGPAYGLGLLITVIAWAAAWATMPQSPPGRSSAVDAPVAARAFVGGRCTRGRTAGWRAGGTAAHNRSDRAVDRPSGSRVRAGGRGRRTVRRLDPP